MELNKLSQKLQNSLENNLPGKNEQYRMLVKAEQPYTFDNTEEDAIQSAVLLLIYEENGNICFMLTERTQTVEHHRGQISLPGGAQEPDENLSDTALRETEEELGILVDNIKILGALTPLFVSITGFMIYPFVGVTTVPLNVISEPSEVAAVFSVNMNDLINDTNMKTESRILRGYDVDIPYFSLSGHKVWGATAMILSEFKAILKESMNA
jgi:8-oxo-dGTP pyrophosphatase MutT (NUDIX family)